MRCRRAAVGITGRGRWLWAVFSQQAVGVLADASLPGRMRAGEVDVDYPASAAPVLKYAPHNADGDRPSTSCNSLLFGKAAINLESAHRRLLSTAKQ